MSQLDIFSLEGRVALIPGGGGGIGSALAEALAGAGARVAVAGRTREACEAAVERVQAAGSEGLAITADATVEADCDRMVAETVARFGRIDIIVNAVGGGAGKALHPAEAYPRVGLGLDHGAQRPEHDAADPGRGADDDRGRPRRSGPQHLVGARQPRDQRRLFRLRGREGRDQLAHPAMGDRVGQARHPGQRDHADLRGHAPGGDRCSRTRRSRPGSSNRIPLGRVGETRDLVGPAIFLCSDAASFVTGQVLGIDGGLTRDPVA